MEQRPVHAAGLGLAQRHRSLPSRYPVRLPGCLGPGPNRRRVCAGQPTGFCPVPDRFDRLCGDGTYRRRGSHRAPEARQLPPGVVLALDAGWSDVGAWDALWNLLPKDAQGNVAQGDVLLHDCQNTLSISQGRLLACIGLRDLVVVETADALLVVHKDRTQDVKKVVDRLKQLGRSESSLHRKVFRPWGWYDSVDAGERFQVKRIVVKPGGMLSLQMHHHRAEHWIVVSGTARVTRDGETFLLSENQSTFIPLGIQHRLENPGQVQLEMIEVQSGSYLGEDDIVRFDDVYGR